MSLECRRKRRPPRLFINERPRQAVCTRTRGFGTMYSLSPQPVRAAIHASWISSMLSIYDLKEMAVTDTPLLLFQCILQNGQAEFWSTHQAVYGGNTYAPRVMKHNLFQVQTSSDQGVDAIPRVSLSLANADSYFSELERSVGWKGAAM